MEREISGTKIENKALAAALEDKVEFTLDEFVKFNLSSSYQSDDNCKIMVQDR